MTWKYKIFNGYDKKKKEKNLFQNTELIRQNSARPTQNFLLSRAGSGVRASPDIIIIIIICFNNTQQPRLVLILVEHSIGTVNVHNAGRQDVFIFPY